MFVLVFYFLDVRELNHEWRGNVRNRAINSQHLHDLMATFKHGIRRYAIEDRLNATMNSDEFSKMIDKQFCKNNNILYTETDGSFQSYGNEQYPTTKQTVQTRLFEELCILRVL
jgi:hypothetical protein